MFRSAALAAMTVFALIGNLPGLAQADSIKFIFPNHGEKTYGIEASGKTVEWVAEQLEKRTGVPSEYFLFYNADSKMFDGVVTADPWRYSSLLERDHTLNDEAAVNVFVRPIVGDHIHTLYTIWIYDGSEYKLVRPLYDGEPRHDSHPEHGETQYHILKVHNGLHTHGKGLIHVHPWTAPKWIHNTAGLGATLGHWLDTVDVTIRKPPYRHELSLEFSNGIYFISTAEFKEIVTNADPNKTTKDYGTVYRNEANKEGIKQVENDESNTWKVLYWNHYLDVKQNKAPAVIDDEIFNIWMGRNLAVAVFVYGPKTDVVSGASGFAATVTHEILRRDITEVTNVKLQEMIDSKMYLNMRQFDRKRYPSLKAADDRYKKLDEEYTLTDQH